MITSVWIPSEKFKQTLNISTCMKQVGIADYEDFYHWSVMNYSDFWQLMAAKLQIIFDKPYQKIVNISQTIETPQWFPGSRLNIINSCFHAPPEKIAIIYQHYHQKIKTISYQRLREAVNRFSNGLLKYAFKPGDAIGIIMPMRLEAVISYLGIIQAGCVVVSIPDSFSPEEIKKRINIAKVKAVVTQDIIRWSAAEISLYQKILAADSPAAIVITDKKKLKNKLREQDVYWENFLSDNTNYQALSCEPDSDANILFSSGTTGDPKGIPWTHITPIKCAADGFLYQNIKAGDVLCWPTSLGWMMGPWLIYAALINQASIALYEGAPTERGFGEFIQSAGVTMLGVVPSLVKAWRRSKALENIDLHTIKLFSSTGEPSNPEDMAYLSALAGNKPIIEYCGGTEIGGAYITNILLKPQAFSRFNTPALGIEVILLDDTGKSANAGEVALAGPSIGLSTRLINKDHHAVYFKDMPLSPEGKILRRHGDELVREPEGFYKMQGRSDDTMKLNGIKISAIEIEQVLIQHIPDIDEAAAIAVTPAGGGPALLVIYLVLSHSSIPETLPDLKSQCQKVINHYLNPFFKIHDIQIIPQLPRTDSNKIRRRKLREAYQTAFPNLS